MSLLNSDDWPHTISLARTSVTNDEYLGSTLTSDTPYETELPAWVQPSTQAEIDEFAHKDQRVTHTIYLSADPGVNMNDEIIVAAVDDAAAFDGVVLAVKSFGNADVGFGLLFKVFCEEYREQPAE